SLFARNPIVHKNFVRNHLTGGIPGENLPFKFDNRFALTLKFIIFFSSGMWAPFLVVTYQLLK
ncbi:COX7C domain containing protein, partial [Asbolus verrucosus]